jgi:hypothetical protein
MGRADASGINQSTFPAGSGRACSRLPARLPALNDKLDRPNEKPKSLKRQHVECKKHQNRSLGSE